MKPDEIQDIRAAIKQHIVGAEAREGTHLYDMLGLLLDYSSQERTAVRTLVSRRQIEKIEDRLEAHAKFEGRLASALALGHPDKEALSAFQLMIIERELLIADVASLRRENA